MDEQKLQQAAAKENDEREPAQGRNYSQSSDLDSLIGQIHEAIEKRKYYEAKSLLVKIFSKNEQLNKKKKSDLLALSAKISYFLGDYPSAKRDANLALQLDMKNSVAHVILGKIALAEYFFSRAIGHFMSANENDPEAQLGLARLYLRLRDLNNARRYLLMAGRLLPTEHPEHNLLQAYMDILEGKNSTGISRVMKFANARYGEPDLLLIGAEALITAGNYAEAKVLLESVEAVSPDNDQLHSLKARIEYAEEDFEGAEASIHKALSKNSFNAMAMTIEMKIVCKKGNLNQAEAIGLKILQQSPEYTLAHANLGDVYFLQGRYEPAMSEYETADSVSCVDTKGAKLRKARVEIIRKNYSTAQILLEEIISKAGTCYDDALCDLAMVYDALGESEKKIELVQRMEVRKVYSRRVEEVLAGLGKK